MVDLKYTMNEESIRIRKIGMLVVLQDEGPAEGLSLPLIPQHDQRL